MSQTNINQSVPKKIPVTIGKNRLRGNSVGAMVDDDLGEDNLGSLRNILRDEATSTGVDPTKEWLANAVHGLLQMYEDAQTAFIAKNNGCIGHVFEAVLPSGKTLLMGERSVLARLS